MILESFCDKKEENYKSDVECTNNVDGQIKLDCYGYDKPKLESMESNCGIITYLKV